MKTETHNLSIKIITSLKKKKSRSICTDLNASVMFQSDAMLGQIIHSLEDAHGQRGGKGGKREGAVERKPCPKRQICYL